MSITITFERGNVPVELSDEAGFRRAIEQRQLRRDTVVKLFVDDGDLKGRFVKAADVEQLRRLFDEIDPPPAPPPPPAATEQAPDAGAEIPPAEDPVTVDAASASPPRTSRPAEPAKRRAGKDRPPVHSLPPAVGDGAPGAAPAPEPAAAADEVKIPLVPVFGLLGVIALGILIASGSGGGSSYNTVNVADTFDTSADMNIGVDASNLLGTEEIAPSTFDTSFDCNAAGVGVVERTICGDRELAGMDVEMSRLYEAVRDAAAPAPARDDLVSAQRAWLAARASCANLDMPRQCIADAFRERIAALRQLRDEQSAAAAALEQGAGAESGNEVADTSAPGVDAAPARRSSGVAVRPARLRSGSITDEDYPERAIDEQAEGTVSALLTVGTGGNVTDCRITRSSGSSVLDGATCKLFTDRLRFDPARDADGYPVASTVQRSVRWSLPY
jgi:TonB family protein